MHVIVEDKGRFTKSLLTVREDRSRKRQLAKASFLRLEAKGDRLVLDSGRASGSVKARVLREGVVFIRPTMLRRLLWETRGGRGGRDAGPMEVIATPRLIRFDDVKFRPAKNQYRLYRDVLGSPAAVPKELASQPETAAEWDPADQQPWLDDKWMKDLATPPVRERLVRRRGTDVGDT